jgi:hypothetical protein
MSTPTPIPTPNLCINCARLLGNRNYPENAVGWKCGHAENRIEAGVDVVTGLPVQKFHTINVYATRGIETMCGNEGRWFEKYEKPAFLPTTVAPDGSIRAPKVSIKNISADDL